MKTIFHPIHKLWNKYDETCPECNPEKTDCPVCGHPHEYGVPAHILGIGIGTTVLCPTEPFVCNDDPKLYIQKCSPEKEMPSADEIGADKSEDFEGDSHAN